MKQMDPKYQEQVVAVLSDVSAALTKVVTAILHIQANLGVAIAVVAGNDPQKQQPEPQSELSPTVDVKEATSEVALEATETVRVVTEQLQRTTAAVHSLQEALVERGRISAELPPDENNQPTPVSEEEAAPTPTSEPNKLSFEVLSYKNYACSVLSPDVHIGCRGFLVPESFRESLFYPDGTPNERRVRAWPVGYYCNKDELMIVAEKFALVYKGLETTNEVDGLLPFIYFYPDGGLPHQITELDPVTFAELRAATLRTFAATETVAA